MRCLRAWELRQRFCWEGFGFDDIYENNALHYLTVDNLDKSLKVINFNSKELPLFNDDIEGITKYIREKLYANYTVIVILDLFYRQLE